MGNLHLRGAFLYPVAAHGLQLVYDCCVTLRVARTQTKDFHLQFTPAILPTAGLRGCRATFILITTMPLRHQISG